jgi:hypothetical protein
LEESLVLDLVWLLSVWLFQLQENIDLGQISYRHLVNPSEAAKKPWNAWQM